MIDLARDVQSRLELEYAVVGFRYAEHAPPEALPVPSGVSCIAQLVLAAARGRSFKLTRDACGWRCAAFFLGFSNSIFPGVERFLSHGLVLGRSCERFLRSPDHARAFIESLRFRAPEGQTAVLAPLTSFDSNRPDVAIILADTDQLSALVYLLQYDAPTDDRRVVTSFASACASMITLPLRMARTDQGSAVWGLHDIAARARFPAHLMSLAMPLAVLETAWRFAPESFLATERWSRLRARGARKPAHPGVNS